MWSTNPSIPTDYTKDGVDHLGRPPQNSKTLWIRFYALKNLRSYPSFSYAPCSTFTSFIFHCHWPYHHNENPYAGLFWSWLIVDFNKLGYFGNKANIVHRDSIRLRLGMAFRWTIISAFLSALQTTAVTWPVVNASEPFFAWDNEN